MKEDAAIKALRQVKKVFDKHGIEYWLNSGTLLGVVRNGKLIEWDSDIDLGTWYEDFDKIASACTELRDKSFSIHFEEDQIGIRVNEKEQEFFISVSMYRLNNDKATRSWLVHTEQHYFRNGIKKVRIGQNMIALAIRYLVWLLSDPTYFGDSPRFVPDIFHIALIKISHALPSPLRKHLAEIVYVVSEKIGCKLIQEIVPSKYFKNLSIIEFYGMKFKVPAETEEYLVYRYGEDWEVPKKYWIYYKDDSAFNYEEENEDIKNNED